jgi:hypothetical protein
MYLRRNVPALSVEGFQAKETEFTIVPLARGQASGDRFPGGNRQV